MNKQINEQIKIHRQTKKKTNKQTFTPHIRQKTWCHILKIETVTMR
jgi:hypothetical protein